MPFWRKRDLLDDDNWDIDDDAWLHLDDVSPTGLRGKRPFFILAALFLIILCSGTVWFRQNKSETRPIISTETNISLNDLQPPTEVSATSALPPSATLPLPSPIPVTPTGPLSISPADYDPDRLAAMMLDLVNTARQANGQSTVGWDETAVSAANLHAHDMVQDSYFSHWNLDGWGPEHRYAQVGGEDVVMENLHAFSYTYDDGRAAPIENWQEVIQNAQIGLMNSPGHRANILDPAHTHVGIGMAYNPETGQFRLAQEFTNQYVQLTQPIPIEVGVGDVVVVNGRIANNNVSNILLDLSYESFPESMTAEELDATSTYSSRAESVNTIAVSAEFEEEIIIGEYGVGFYHIRIFGDLPTGQSLLMDRIVRVR